MFFLLIKHIQLKCLIKHHPTLPSMAFQTPTLPIWPSSSPILFIRIFKTKRLTKTFFQSPEEAGQALQGFKHDRDTSRYKSGVKGVGLSERGRGLVNSTGNSFCVYLYTRKVKHGKIPCSFYPVVHHNTTAPHVWVIRWKVHCRSMFYCVL